MKSIHSASCSPQLFGIRSESLIKPFANHNRDYSGSASSPASASASVSISVSVSVSVSASTSPSDSNSDSDSDSKEAKCNEAKKDVKGPRFKDLGGMKKVLEHQAVGRPNWLTPLPMKPAFPFITFLPQASSIVTMRSHNVLVIAATNGPDALDPALRRSGRFDLEISFDVPDESDRVEILKVVTSNLCLEGPLDLVKIARSTSGYVGADLRAVADRASDIARKRILAERYPNMSIASMNEANYNED
ncbi:unnamed protein product [Prunus armeniaca]|uniref:Uncharacterized protein n=1 Tax=Prunus armeniaca TaxID=36596 RepID=A0A6J5UYF1_PRUAR|nr:unnamed protein product [Prunus armeniaca]